MYGLRLINNNYVANGTGRDLTINYDASFRGGRFGAGQQVQHLPKPWVDTPKTRKHHVTGPDARVEPHTQTLNCSSPSSTFIRSQKARHTESAKYSFPLAGASTRNLMLTSSSHGASPGMLRAASEPRLGDSYSSFRPRWDLPAAFLDSEEAYAWQQEAPPPQDAKKSSMLPSYWKPKDPFLDWPAPGTVHPTAGFSRTDGGSPWPN
eukprot:TRINITY_DN1023_c0_g1_i1.p1 TRINITY_DN1023_c0_g1~~TRINITY_DN1023_c0_g1_i1.p1  ORF type:complete len:240 (-),score=36.75 TRINITY_DN1023_c0_g1_i1:30-650(-)